MSYRENFVLDALCDFEPVERFEVRSQSDKVVFGFLVTA